MSARDVAVRFCTVSLWMILAALPAAAQTPEDLFDQGNNAYAEGRWQDAADAYSRVLRFGVTDARLEYNLGNAQYKMNNLGRAILHYARAARLDPTDPDIRANLALARQSIVDQVDVPPVSPPVQWVVRLQNLAGPDLQAWIGLVLGWLAAGLVGWAASSPGRFRPAAIWVLIVLLLLLAVTGVSWWLTYQRLEGSREAVVLDPAVEVLAGPGANNATLFTVHEGLTVKIRAERDDWLQVSLPDGLNGWLLREQVGEL